METFDFLCSVCRYTEAFTLEQEIRRSLEFPMLTSDIATHMFSEKEAVVAMPINNTLVLSLSCHSIKSQQLDIHPEQVEFNFGTTSHGMVNKLLYQRALRMFDRICDHIDLLLDGPTHYSRSGSGSNSRERHSSTHFGNYVDSPFQNNSISSPFSLGGAGGAGAAIKRSANSIISLAKVYIGGKLLRMHRFSTSFFEEALPLVIFTGYRLGGALTELLAAMVKIRYGVQLMIKVVTFGSPCVGNAKFNASTSSLFKRHYKIVLQQDGFAAKTFGGAYKQPQHIVKISPKGHYAVQDLWCCNIMDNYCTLDEYSSAIRITMQVEGNRTIVGCVTSLSDDEDLKRL